MDIVTRAAEILAPGVFEDWYDGTGPDAKVVTSARQKYQRAEARRKAADILKLAATTPNLAHLLAECEKDDWDKLGLPVRGSPDAERVVEEKYGLSNAD